MVLLAASQPARSSKRLKSDAAGACQVTDLTQFSQLGEYVNLQICQRDQ